MGHWPAPLCKITPLTIEQEQFKLLLDVSQVLGERAVTMSHIEVWVVDLRDQLQRGELTGRGPIMLRDGSRFLDAERAVRIMLADLAHLDALPSSYYPARLITLRRHQLLADFQHLRPAEAG